MAAQPTQSGRQVPSQPSRPFDVQSLMRKDRYRVEQTKASQNLKMSLCRTPSPVRAAVSPPSPLLPPYLGLYHSLLGSPPPHLPHLPILSSPLHLLAAQQSSLLASAYASLAGPPHCGLSGLKQGGGRFAPYPQPGLPRPGQDAPGRSSAFQCVVPGPAPASPPASPPDIKQSISSIEKMVSCDYSKQNRCRNWLQVNGLDGSSDRKFGVSQDGRREVAQSQ